MKERDLEITRLKEIIAERDSEIARLEEKVEKNEQLNDGYLQEIEKLEDKIEEISGALYDLYRSI